METAKPILADAEAFASGVRAAFPHQMLAYNLSPSFNWDSVSAISATKQLIIYDNYIITKLR
jgi:isocitrate lyase